MERGVVVLLRFEVLRFGQLVILDSPFTNVFGVTAR